MLGRKNAYLVEVVGSSGSGLCCAVNLTVFGVIQCCAIFGCSVRCFGVLIMGDEGG